MRLIVFISLLAASFMSVADHNYRCKRTGSNADYQEMVSDFQRHLLDKGFYPETVAYLDQYADKPIASILNGKPLRKGRCGKAHNHKGEKKKDIGARIPAVPVYKVETRIEEAVGFYETHYNEYAPIAKRYGVPFSVVVAILSMETRTCTFNLRYPAIHTFLTHMYFYKGEGRVDEQGDFTFVGGNRDAKFKPPEEIEALLRMYEDRILLDESQWNGSYAGAMGCPQFLPSSIERFGVSTTVVDGMPSRIDIYNNTADVVASVANYISEAGWVEGAVACEPVKVPWSAMAKIRGRSKGDSPEFYFGYSEGSEKTASEWQADDLGITGIPESLLVDAETRYRFLFLYDKGNRKRKRNVSGCLIGVNAHAIHAYNNAFINYVWPVYELAIRIEELAVIPEPIKQTDEVLNELF